MGEREQLGMLAAGGWAPAWADLRGWGTARGLQGRLNSIWRLRLRGSLWCCLEDRQGGTSVPRAEPAWEAQPRSDSGCPLLSTCMGLHELPRLASLQGSSWLLGSIQGSLEGMVLPVKQDQWVNAGWGRRGCGPGPGAAGDHSVNRAVFRFCRCRVMVASGSPWGLSSAASPLPGGPPLTVGRKSLIQRAAPQGLTASLCVGSPEAFLNREGVSLSWGLWAPPVMCLVETLGCGRNGDLDFSIFKALRYLIKNINTDTYSLNQLIATVINNVL